MPIGLSFIFSILFWPGIASAATTPRWAFLAIAVPVALFSIPKIRLTLSHLILMAVLIWSVASFFWSIVGYDWVLEFSRLLIICGLFIVGAQLGSLRPLLIGASIGVAVNSGIVIAQIYGWPVIEQVVSPAGLFMNKNLLAEFSVLVLVGAIYERLWWAIIPIMPSVILTGSRGAYVALVASIFLMVFRNTPRLLVSLGAVSSAIFGVYFLSHFDGSGLERLDIWRDTLGGYTWFGHGLGQFYVDFPDHATRLDTLAQRPEHAHNDLLELGYDLGVGVVFVLAFILSVWRSSLPTERAVLLAFGIIGCFSFPFYMPATAAVFAVVAGRLAGNGASLRDDLDAGRVALRNSYAAITGFFHGGKTSGESQQPIPDGIPNQECSSLPLHGVEATRHAA